MSKRGEIFSIQILRGLSAIIVMFVHVPAFVDSSYHRQWRSGIAAIGVDMFFIISGFVMYYSNVATGRPIGGFLIGRLIRIVPLYWLATAVVCAFFLAGFHPVGLHVVSARILLESALFIPSTFPGGRHDLILSIGWTLMYELFFYACFALSLAFGTGMRSLAALAALFAVLVLTGLLAGPLPYLADFFTRPIILEFLYGGMLALIYTRCARIVVPWQVPAGVVVIVVGIALVLDVLGMPVPANRGWRFLSYGLPALLLVGSALALERRIDVARVRLPLLIGAASYPLYLFHPLVLQIVVKAVARLLPSAIVGPAVAVSAALVAAILLGILVHVVVERRVLALGRSFLAARHAGPGADVATAQRKPGCSDRETPPLAVGDLPGGTTLRSPG